MDIQYKELYSKVAIELAKWAFELKHHFKNKQERLKAIKLFKKVNKYEKIYRKHHSIYLSGFYEEVSFLNISGLLSFRKENENEQGNTSNISHRWF